MSRLVVSDLWKSFADVSVLRGVDLDVPSGALAAVLGPSGCGKTTLLRIIAGFAPADRGRIRLDDRQVSDGPVGLAPERRRVGVVPQEGALFPHLTAAGNVGFGLSRRRHARAENSRRVAELLELVGLDGYADRMPSELSGGQQQRVALARALAPGPDVVLLDEPFAALDAGLRASVRADVRAALHESGATAVLVTHDQDEALSMADQVVVLRDGVAVQSGTPEAIYHAPADLDVARFVGDAIVLPATAGGSVAQTPLGPVDLRAAAAGAGQVVVRPEQLRLASNGHGVRATITDRTFHGNHTVVTMDVVGPDGRRVRVSCRTHDPVPDDDQVGLRLAGPVSFYPDR